MPRRKLRLPRGDGEALRAGFARIRRELRLPTEFPPEVLAEAQAAARRLPAGEDRSDLPMLTIDPPDSRDLDQAMYLKRRGRGYRVHYAIADVAAFLAPGGPLDREAHARGLTLYAPDASIPLHPPVLSAGAASLLPGELRPALLWTLDLDADGQLVATDVGRALVRSRERYDYETVSELLAAGRADERLLLLGEVGRLRERHERERGAVTLPTPEQEVVEQDGGFALAYRAPFDVEGWNAQISLLTGMAAAALMLAGQVGVLRTLPAAPPEAVERLRRTADALGVPWPPEMSYAELLRALD
ncbi:MAG: RNB domain-containing ribonuclease, partial [Actinomycetota bacterium]|nr:RNB domain-containing ribonuclease [Actinomycetota bacterium]